MIKGKESMRIDKVNVYKVQLAFRGDFSISRMRGLSSNTIVVEVIGDKGEIRGYGEGVPIEFVTGETPDSAMKNVKLLIQKDCFPWELSDIWQVYDFVDSLPDGKEQNSAICALEMSLLDALGKSENKSILEYFPKTFYRSKVRYGASVTLGSRERVMQICQLIKNLGIAHLRIKMGKDFDQNRDATEAVNKVFGDDCELRIDPNGVWDRDLAFRHLSLIEEYGVEIVEEPMMRHSPGFSEFAEILQARRVILMACESAPTLGDVRRIIEEGYHQMINVKLSRSGGFRRSLGIIEYLREKGSSFQIGCTLGESGLLSAAGRAFSLLCSDAVYCDGSYDDYLLEKNITYENVSFGSGGEAGPLDGPGLGVEVNGDSLDRLSDRSITMTILKP
jgi:L-alanine-DL-glutamate epimerase-like enolase superfamily enzyme